MNIDLPVDNQFKYLGVYLDRSLTWSRHIGTKLAAIKLNSAQMGWITYIIFTDKTSFFTQTIRILKCKFLIAKNRQDMGINRQIVSMIFSELKIVKMKINRQIWQL